MRLQSVSSFKWKVMTIENIYGQNRTAKTLFVDVVLLRFDVDTKLKVTAMFISYCILFSIRPVENRKTLEEKKKWKKKKNARRTFLFTNQQHCGPIASGACTYRHRHRLRKCNETFFWLLEIYVAPACVCVCVRGFRLFALPFASFVVITSRK